MSNDMLCVEDESSMHLYVLGAMLHIFHQCESNISRQSLSSTPSPPGDTNFEKLMNFLTAGRENVPPRRLTSTLVLLNS
jgi:hypothetical protein